MRNGWLGWRMVIVLLLLLTSINSLGSANGVIDPLHKEAAYPVSLDGEDLFWMKARVGSFTAEERARMVSERLLRVGQDYSLDIAVIHIQVEPAEASVLLENRILLTITEADAKAEQSQIAQLAQDRAEVIKAALFRFRQERNAKSISVNVLQVILLSACMVGLFWLIDKGLGFLRGKLAALVSRMELQRFRQSRLFSAARAQKFVGHLVSILGWIVKAWSVYFYAYLVLGLFPGTRQYSKQLLGYVITPLAAAAHLFLQYLPNFLIISIIVLISRYFLKLLRLFFDEVKRGAIQISGFYVEWCDPTYQIVRFLVLALTLISVYPYIPGADSPVFQGISVLFGVLFSLGSTSAIANIVAGISLTYTRSFVIGDRIKIGDNVGDVLEKTLLVTRIRTIKNVDISIPNSTILNSPIINYSRAAEQTKLILHTQVTIGYDAPWRKVHELLRQAAAATPNVLAEPSPFVLQTSLDDFYVTYQLNVYTDQPQCMAKTYSDLHQNIQDAFNTAQVEIMSPHYKAVRDGNQVTIPAENLPASYTAPAFKIGASVIEKSQG